MSYLKFDKNQMINLDHSLYKEMLRTNQSGAYHCTTVVGCNTRKQHGLLVVPIPELGNKNYVMLSSLDETVIQHGAPFNLGIHRYKGGVYSPNGHKYIREVDFETVPRVTYRVGGVILTKEKVFISHENRILIRYTLVEAHSPTKLQFRPFLAFRESNELCIANNAIDPTMTPCDNGVSCCLYKGFPRLYMQFNHKPEWVDQGSWYNGIEYVKDLDRGVPYCEDLYVPGYFELPIKKGETIIFSAGLSEAKPRSFAAMYEKELGIRTHRTSFFNCLKNAAKQFYRRDGGDEQYIISGYPWGVVLARNTMMALPGLTLTIGHIGSYERTMATIAAALNNYLDTGQKSDRIAGIDLPDIPLWGLWALQQYAKQEGWDKARDKYMPLVTKWLDAILTGRHPRLKVNADTGMVEADGTHEPISWMNSVLNGKPVIPRTGYLVEFNGLWYNGLRFAAKLIGDTEDYQEHKKRYEEAADKMEQPFVDTFLNDYGYLYDYVNGTYADPQVRPNMAVAIGMDYSPLTPRQRRGVLDIVTRELLTPKGLRSLSPKSYGYHPFYKGTPEERELAMHQGPVRPWLMGFYTDAYIRVFGLSGLAAIDRMLIGFEDEMPEGCIGSLSQMYDANPPYAGRGAVSHASNVAEVLRSLRTIKKLEDTTLAEGQSDK